MAGRRSRARERRGPQTGVLDRSATPPLTPGSAGAQSWRRASRRHNARCLLRRSATRARRSRSAPAPSGGWSTSATRDPAPTTARRPATSRSTLPLASRCQCSSHDGRTGRRCATSTMTSCPERSGTVASRSLSARSMACLSILGGTNSVKPPWQQARSITPCRRGRGLDRGRACQVRGGEWVDAADDGRLRADIFPPVPLLAAGVIVARRARDLMRDAFGSRSYRFSSATRGSRSGSRSSLS